MSRRSQIVNALVSKINEVDGSTGWKSNFYSNAIPRAKFWEDIDDYPTTFVVASDETREYLPGGFKWAYLNIVIRIFVKDEDDTLAVLEPMLEDIETVIDSNGVLEYATGETTEDIRITSISTDEGVLSPIGVGEVILLVQYDLQSPCPLI